MNAWDDVQRHLGPDEEVEAAVFGEWGWGGGYLEPEPPPVPDEVQGKVLTPDEAKPLMDGWSFIGGYGAPECYAVRIWTNKQVLWITQYDGSTCLDSAPRDPENHMPNMPGG